MLNFTVKNPSKGCSLFMIIFWAYGIVSYVINVVKLCQCDWQLAVSIKHEVIHGIGLFPGVSMITCWF